MSIFVRSPFDRSQASDPYIRIKGGFLIGIAGNVRLTTGYKIKKTDSKRFMNEQVETIIIN